MNAPRRWKVVLVNFVVVFPTIQAIARFATPWFADWPVLARDVLIVVLMCIVLSYAIPKANRYWGDWVHR